MEHERDEDPPFNSPTFLTGVWLMNDFKAYAYWQHAAREAWEEARTWKEVTELNCKRSDAARLLLAEKLQKEITASAPSGEVNLFSHLVKAALSDVDWLYIADEFLEELYGELDPLEAIQCARGDMEP
jgi:hypothetical protein